MKLADLHKRRIAATLPQGVDLPQVLAEVESAAERFRQDEEAERGYESVEVTGPRTLRVQRKSYPSKGAPPKVALRVYLTTLVAIYEHATGKRIGRNVDAYAEKGERAEKPHPFLAACLKAAGKRYPFGLVRQVLNESHGA